MVQSAKDAQIKIIYVVVYFMYMSINLDVDGIVHLRVANSRLQLSCV